MKRNPELYLKELGLEIVEELGKGHFGKCYHIREGRMEYTAKTINPDITNVFAQDYTQHTIQYSQKVEHLLDEMRILRALGSVDGIQGLITHHHKVYGAGTALRNFLGSNGFCRDQDIVLIKEYIPGRAMEKDEYLTGPRARELENIVNDVHIRGIAGFGIKRENIILSANGNTPYIIDLGHARIFRSTPRKEFWKDRKFKEAIRSDLDELKNVIDYMGG